MYLRVRVLYYTTLLYGIVLNSCFEYMLHRYMYTSARVCASVGNALDHKNRVFVVSEKLLSTIKPFSLMINSITCSDNVAVMLRTWQWLVEHKGLPFAEQY